MLNAHSRRRLTAVASVAVALSTASAGLAVGSATATTPTPGVTNSSITIGATVPLSGIANTYAEVSAAAAAVFNYVNSKGGINKRKINYIRKDDCYDIATLDKTCTNGGLSTIQQTTALLSTTGGLFGTVDSLGTTAQTSVMKSLHTAGVPQLFVNSGAPTWNHPGDSATSTSTTPAPWNTLYGYQPSYTTEGKIFGTYIKATYKNAKVGFMGQSDFGPQGLQGLTESGITPVSTQYYNAADALFGTKDIAPAVLALKNAQASVVVLDSIPPFTKLIIEDATSISFSPHWVISSVGSDPIAVNDAKEVGAVTLDWFPTTTSTNAWNTWLRKVLTDDPTLFPGFGPSSHLDGNEQYGAATAVAFCEALYSLGSSTSAITRTSFLAAMTKVKFATESLTPLSYSATNHQGLQGGLIATVAANGTSAPFAVTETTTGKPVYTTTDSKTSKVVNSAIATSSIPSYLQ